MGVERGGRGTVQWEQVQQHGCGPWMRVRVGMAGRPKNNGEPPAGGGGKLYREKRSGGGVVQKTGQAGVYCTL